MCKRLQRQRNDEGFVLVAALMFMLVLTIIGIAMNRDTNTEVQIAGNDMVHKQTFYEADGATEFAAEVIEQNIACTFFQANGNGSVAMAGGIILDGNIAVRDSGGLIQPWLNNVGTYVGNYPTDGPPPVRDMWLPPNFLPGQPHTNITVQGAADLTPGASIILSAGYLGLGRALGSGGVFLDYEIRAQHIGVNNSESVVEARYRHVVGREDPFCRYW